MTSEVLGAIITAAIVAITAAIRLAGNRTRRWIETEFDPALYGMPSRAALIPDRAGPPPIGPRTRKTQEIADAASTGDWKPAAGYVAAAGGDWDDRWVRVRQLTAIALTDDSWLRKWRTAEPGCCDAAVIEADLMVQRAWRIRGSGTVRQVPKPAMASFRAQLPAAIEAARHAALLDPADPNPWIVMITAARGAGYRRAKFRELWTELTARAPHHYDAHWQALQYWCAKWHGSDRAMMSFARRAVRNAPMGSPLAGLILHALYERGKSRPLEEPVRALFERRRLKTAVNALALVPEHDPHLPPLRHLLAHHLVRARMWKAALDQFRRLGPWCGATPWTDRPDPAKAFHTARGLAAARSKIETGQGVVSKRQGMVR
ncbi:hypothetical protein ACFVVL_26715 [Kitasatospora sp. NPDC058115]|uniref:hypothetical protein n=1 Tax=Kitasatospora sp. NPDC058115 TaxID=3346347 RepID=UPI0036DB5D4F